MVSKYGKVTMKVTSEAHEFLNMSGRKGQTYSDIILSFKEMPSLPPSPKAKKGERKWDTLKEFLYPIRKTSMRIEKIIQKMEEIDKEDLR